jgi:rhodanese-related sulfurtransferase
LFALIAPLLRANSSCRVFVWSCFGAKQVAVFKILRGCGVALESDAVVEDVSVLDVWKLLDADKNAQLVDVRTRPEWAFVGVPDVSSLGRRVHMIEWQTFPDSRIDPAFKDRLKALLDSAGVKKDADLFFICRSGGRSRMAAEAMAAVGYTRCHNVAEGFEGPLDADRHRGTLAGWKSAGLPWVQG